MACSVTEPSSYLKQYSFVTAWDLRNSQDDNFAGNGQEIRNHIAFGDMELDTLFPVNWIIVEQTSELPVIWEAFAFMWHHRNI